MFTREDLNEFDDGFPRLPAAAAIAKAAGQVGEAAVSIGKAADAATVILTRVNDWLARVEELLP